MSPFINDHSFILAHEMPRKRTVPDHELLDAALVVVHSEGPEALTFAALAHRTGLAASTLVQRFGSKAGLLRAALGRAWDELEARTAEADAVAGGGPAGVVGMLVALTAPYEAHDYADQLLVLREDLRDPVLRARGQAWIATLVDAVERRLGGPGTGLVVVAQWQGLLTVWGFTRTDRLDRVVRAGLDELVTRLRPPAVP
jgi:AcrR family transcriptional regulator